MQSDGFIVLHRKITDSYLWSMPLEQKWVALVILLHASWRDTQWWDGKQSVSVPRGTLITSLPNLARLSGLSIKSVRTALKNLESAGFLAGESTSRWRRISVINYRKYQDIPAANDNQTGRPAAGDGQASGRPAAASEQDNQETNISFALSGEPEKRERAKKGGALLLTGEEAAAFERFYAAYPRKKQPRDAEKAFRAAIQRSPLAEILEGLERAKAQPKWQREPEFIPFPASWLNADGWRDEADPEPTATDAPTLSRRSL